MGAMDVMGIRSIRCMHPCRCCCVKRSNIWDIQNSNNQFLRSSTSNTMFLSEAFEIFCKKMKNFPLLAREIDVLDSCVKEGIHPILPAILQLEVPHPQFSAYCYTPVDLLHTLLSGMIRDWIVMTEVIGTNYTYICIYIHLHVCLNVVSPR